MSAVDGLRVLKAGSGAIALSGPAECFFGGNAPIVHVPLSWSMKVARQRCWLSGRTFPRSHTKSRTHTSRGWRQEQPGPHPRYGQAAL